jgi:hypothetical protein
MKVLALMLSVGLAAIGRVSAQVTVEVVLEQAQFLPSESLPVAVRITNRSGQALRLGEEADWLTFLVEGEEGLIVGRSGEIPVRGEFELGSSRVATKRVDLMPYFNLSRPGRYQASATVRVSDWGREFASEPKFFDITPGTKLWEQEIGVPPEPGGSGQPEVRKYILQQANYLKQLKLYLRLTDAPETRVYRVFALGPMVSFSRPEPQVDQFSNLHVLCQDGARSFTYSVVKPDGERLLRQTYDYVSSRPRLRIDAEGKISVAGGLRRVTRNDLPAPETASSSNDVQAPKP